MAQSSIKEKVKSNGNKSNVLSDSLDQEVSNMSFESAMQELETIVEMLESGDIPLDKAVHIFERASILYKSCEEQLSAAELKISKVNFDKKSV